ncbi:MAG: hypothetical protein R2851_17930 [Caldilineaceae bacterium]
MTRPACGFPRRPCCEGLSGYGSYALMLIASPPRTGDRHCDDRRRARVDAGHAVFTPDNWDAPQEIAVRAVDDEVDWSTGGASHAHAIDHLVHSDDPGITTTSGRTQLNVAVRDNDAAGVTVVPFVDVSEDGQSATYQVGLTSMPHAPVQIWALPDAQVTTASGVILRLRTGPSR